MLYMYMIYMIHKIYIIYMYIYMYIYIYIYGYKLSLMERFIVYVGQWGNGLVSPLTPPPKKKDERNATVWKNIYKI